MLWIYRSFSNNGTVLIYGDRAVRDPCLCVLMMTYHWGFEKTNDNICSKRPDIDLNKGPFNRC
jgi:hypothetical protein